MPHLAQPSSIYKYKWLGGHMIGLPQHAYEGPRTTSWRWFFHLFVGSSVELLWVQYWTQVHGLTRQVASCTILMVALLVWFGLVYWGRTSVCSSDFLNTMKPRLVLNSPKSSSPPQVLGFQMYITIPGSDLSNNLKIIKQALYWLVRWPGF